MTHRFTLMAVAVFTLGLTAPIVAEEPKPRATFEPYSSPVLAIAYSPDGKMFASAARLVKDRAWCIHIWDTATNKEIRMIRGNDSPIRSICFSPDSKSLASSDENKAAAIVYDVETGKEKLSIPYPKTYGGEVEQVAYSPDGKTLAVGTALNGGAIGVYDANTGKRMSGHSGVRFVFGMDNKLLARGSQSPTILVWDLTASKEREPINTKMKVVSGVAFSPDSKTLAVGGIRDNESNNSIQIWDVETGKEKVVLKGHANWTIAVAYSPDGRYLAGASYDKGIRLWDAATGELALTLPDKPYAIAFSPDSKTLAVGGQDKKVRLWDVPKRDKK